MSSNDNYEVILIGDAGAACTDREDPVLKMLAQQLPASAESAVVFLGDNIYPRGLPPEKHPLRKISEKRLLAQLDVVKDYKGRLIFLSGNHDWNVGKKNGYEYVLRQEEYVRKYFNGRDVFLPRGGCPGPVEINVNDQFTIIAINTQWWVQTGFRPVGASCGCTVNSEDDFFWDLYKILENNKGKRVLIVGHAPVYSYGAHGGRYLLRHHIFPLTMFRKKWFVPLPGLGSLVALYRKFIGVKEDLAHPRYRRFRVQLKNVMRHFPDVIYAAGHEHNLQYICRNDNHFIVSGSATKVQFLRPGKHSLFGTANKGFFKLRVNADMSVDMEVWKVDISGNPSKAFSKRMLEAVVKDQGTSTMRAEGSA
jgi:predicted phosphodiesterase